MPQSCTYCRNVLQDLSLATIHCSSAKNYIWTDGANEDAIQSELSLPQEEMEHSGDNHSQLLRNPLEEFLQFVPGY